MEGRVYVYYRKHKLHDVSQSVALSLHLVLAVEEEWEDRVVYRQAL